VTAPANLIAGLLSPSGGHITLSMLTPLNGSNIGNNSASQVIAGTAQSTAGNITSLQYQIDGGAWTNFTFTPALSVNYSGGNVGGVGAGGHVVTVKATDAAANSTTVSASYGISATRQPTSYSWGPYATYTGQNNFLTIVNSTPNATVAYMQTISDAHSDAIYTQGMTAIGVTDSYGNFSYTGTAAWPVSGWSDSVQLYVGGVQVGTFSFANFGVNPQYSYTPSTVVNGGTVTLSIANSWASSTVTQVTTMYPSGVSGPVQVLGSTSTTGNFSYTGTANWGNSASCSTTVSLNGQPIGTFSFVP
jgi:hypothetical protein